MYFTCYKTNEYMFVNRTLMKMKMMSDLEKEYVERRNTIQKVVYIAEFSLTLLNLCKTAEEYEARAITAIVYLWPELVSVQNRKFSEPQPRTPMFSGGNDISHW